MIERLGSQDGLMTSMRRLRVGCEFEHWAEVDTPAVFQVEPCESGVAGVVRREWTSTPEVPLRTYVDVYGNVCRRITLSAGSSIVGYDAVVTVPDAPERSEERSGGQEW